MKNIILSGVIMLLVNCCLGQICSNSYFLNNGVTMDLTDYDANGLLKGKQSIKILNANGTTSTIHSTKTDEQGKVTEDRETKYECTPTGAKLYFGYTDSKTKQEAFLLYPLHPIAGEKIGGDVNLEMEKVNEEGKKVKMTLQITDRKFEGMEEISTPLGKLDCMKIKCNTKIKIKLGMISIPIEMDAIEWYSFQIGVVKSETYVKGKREGTTELTALKR